MVNIEDFIKRLEVLLDYYGVNASAFADKIGVQRSSLSHLLSGRNKPSLDFVLKILEVYPDVDLYWILNGQGSFPKIETPLLEKESVVFPPIIAPSNTLFDNPKAETYTTKESSKEQPPKLINQLTNETSIDKIVIFYKDGTFKSYNPE